MPVATGSTGGSSIGGVESMPGTTPNSPSEASGANTFSSLKGMFKQQYGQKKCKHCGTMFTPKTQATKV